MGPRCSSAETQVCHRSYTIVAIHHWNIQCICKNSCCVGINSTSSGKSPSKAKFGNSEKASELAILTVFDKLNNCFFIVSLDYELKLTMQIVHPGLLTRSETNTFTVN